MFENITEMHRDALEDILKARRSVRALSAVPPEKVLVEKIIRAGYVAPFASIPAMGKTDFRRIAVIAAGSDAFSQIDVIVRNEFPKLLSDNKEKVDGSVTFMQDPGGITRLLGNAPYLIVAAERKGRGFPPTYTVEQSISLSYCMYNMWLTAVSLKIGFKLVTTFVHLKLGNNSEFCDLMGIPCGEYAVDACAIGYPGDKFKVPNITYPDYESNTVWL
jgi:nitroreductase